MARRLHLFGKKRGNRSSELPKLGSIGTGLFSTVCFLFGGVLLVIFLLNWTIPEWQANKYFVETAGTVKDKHIGTQAEGVKAFRPEVELEYQAEGETYRQWTTYDISGSYAPHVESAQEILDDYELGGECTLWYDPKDPSRAVLRRGYSWFAWLTLLLPTSFLVIGGGGLVYTLLNFGKSTERRVTIAQRASELDLLKEQPGEPRAFPYVPDFGDISDSPGTTLAHRLPMASNMARIWWLLMAILFWNGTISYFLVILAQGHMRGRPDYLLTLFILPFFAVGLYLVFDFARRVMALANQGMTIVEIDEHPLYPGAECELCITQSGHSQLEWLRVSLVCDEEATFRDGTNTRTESARVHESDVLVQDDFQASPSAQFEARCSLQIPPGAMHSFQSDHNRILWKLVVQARSHARATFERAFLLHVYPVRIGSSKA